MGLAHLRTSHLRTSHLRTSHLHTSLLFTVAYEVCQLHFCSKQLKIRIFLRQSINFQIVG